MSKKDEKIIILSLEEAKNIVETIDLLCEFVNINTDFVSDLFIDGCATKKILNNRIKQAEIKHLKREIAQLKEDQEVDNYLKNQFLKSVGNKE